MQGMTSKERMFIAMSCGVPDRVPVMCQLSLGHYFLHSGIDPIDVWYSSDGFSDALVRMQQRYHFDGILVNLHGRPENWRSYISSIETINSEKKINWKTGGFTIFPPDDNPHYYQADGSRFFPSLDDINPDDLFYADPWQITGYSWPYKWDFEDKLPDKNHFFPDTINDTLKKVIQKTKGEVSVHGEIYSPFSQFLELLNYEPALMALLTEPEKSAACLDALSDGAIRLGISEAACGADAVLISSAFAGSGFISREFYEQFVLPYEKKVISGIKTATSIPVYTHTCGGIGDRLDLMMETGTNGIDTLDPPPLGTVELEEAIAQTKGKVFIKGNLDAVNELLKGDDDMLEQSVCKRLTTAMPGGGYILSTACSVSPHTKPEQIEKLFQLAEKYGRYSR